MRAPPGDRFALLRITCRDVAGVLSLIFAAMGAVSLAELMEWPVIGIVATVVVALGSVLVSHETEER